MDHTQKHQVIDATNAVENQGGFVGLGGFYVRQFMHKKGSNYIGHAHHIDHVGNLLSGQVRVHWRDPDGAKGVIDMLVPSKIHMPKDRWHQIECMTDEASWECWFAQAEDDRLCLDPETNWTLEK